MKLSHASLKSAAGLTFRLAVLFFLCWAASSAALVPCSFPTTTVSAAQLERIGQSLLRFEKNQGQTDAAVKFLARGPGYTLFLTADEAVLQMQSGVRSGKLMDSRYQQALSEKHGLIEPNAPTTSSVLRLNLVGAQPARQITEQEPLRSQSQYFTQVRAGATGITAQHFARVLYREIYPGIDVAYYGKEQRLEYDFLVAPGADPRQIVLQFSGAETIALAENGDLVLRLPAGELRQPRPVVYQEVDGIRRTIAGQYVLLGETKAQHGQPADAAYTVGFSLGAYDTTLPLVIDPELNYASYLGTAGRETGDTIAVDATGKIIVAGVTTSVGFPIKNPYQNNYRGGPSDIYISRFDPTASGPASFLSSTFLGGGNEDNARSLTIDNSGKVYLVGATNSTDFPTVNAYQTNNRGQYDAFVTKFDFSATGSAQLLYSSYLGGNFGDECYGIAVNDAGVISLVGGTLSTNLPTTSGALQTNLSGEVDCFVAQLDPSAQGAAQLRYSTYLGGGQSDYPGNIAVDGAGIIFLGGFTFSGNFPVTPTAYQSSKNTGGRSPTDAFITKLNPTATGSAQLVYSTFFGGNDFEGMLGFAIDKAGNVYLGGWTFSSIFPTLGAFQSNRNGTSDGFIVKLNPSVAGAGALLYSTYFGGTRDEFVNSIAVDLAGTVHVTGQTNSVGFPLKNALLSNLNGIDDAVIFRLNPKLTGTDSLLFSTYFGGGISETGVNIATDAALNTYVVGSTVSLNFPVTTNAYQSTFGGSTNEDAFIVKLTDANNAADLELAQTVAPTQPSPGGTATITLTVKNNGPATAYQVSVTDQLPAELTVTACQTSDGGVCGGSGNNRSAGFAELAANATATVTLSVTVRDDLTTGATVQNTARVSAPADSNNANNTATLTITLGNPVPQLTNLSPNAASVGGAAFTLTVNGTGFLNGATVLWNGQARPTTFVSATQLTAAIPDTDLANAGTANVTVTNPAPGGGTSNSLAVTITQGRFEADVAGRPDGNGTVTVSDWVQLGRFASGLDTPDNGGEFQRADCAPRSSAGDGRLSVADWSQAGRYASGLDAVVLAAGPTAPVSFVVGNATSARRRAAQAASADARTIRLTKESLTGGRQILVTVELDAQGGENAWGGSLSFDPSIWRFVGAGQGDDASQATVFLNTAQTAQGLVGLTLALPAGQELRAGTRRIAVFRFTALPRRTNAKDSFVFGNHPVVQQLVDVWARELTLSIR